MIRFVIPALAMAAAASSAQAAEVQIAATGPVVELTVNEIVRAAPDVAQVGAGVTTRAATAQEAMRLNAQQIERLIDRLRALGIDRKDIQTANFSLNAQYQYRNDGEQPTFIGYDVSNQLNVKLRDLKRAGEVLDELVGAGANNIYGPNFMLEDDVAANAEARKAAFARGRAMAEDYARMAGYSGVRLLEVSESFQSYGPMPMAEGAIAVTATSRDAKTQIEPGQVGTGVTVTVKYEMTR
ncbi:SIMPL domain-containing protein [Qipengyuania sp. 6B39]|uniref:SIMPL domain-containing protein n=1 Tax=Qipengyuania proteolytica TaxID=2867239 RepID=UPI001C8935DA|nr:SIMPL domain-containing protein [Qipengyuania proteolytica]MBX7495679.1 SIMPL domain-containing protein [Qipengyuania proteolytica]